MAELPGPSMRDAYRPGYARIPGAGEGGAKPSALAGVKLLNYDRFMRP
jgi:hypothetical protein